MMPSHPRQLTAAVLSAIGMLACSSAAQQTPATSPRPDVAVQGNPAGIAKAKADSALHPYTAADIEFMSHMISHHAQAIVMSGWAPTHGASPSIRTLAERIIAAQKDEIHTMQTWLRDRLQPVPEASATGMKMMMNGVEHEMLMPGMLTDVQMKQLDAARGGEFDQLFLRFMIQHHKGAVTMVKELFGTYGAGQDEATFKFASDVNVDQATEIARMEKMLLGLTLGISPP
jgi:uncharacterized protein (DUF305 family)